MVYLSAISAVVVNRLCRKMQNLFFSSGQKARHSQVVTKSEDVHPAAIVANVRTAFGRPCTYDSVAWDQASRPNIRPRKRGVHFLRISNSFRLVGVTIIDPANRTFCGIRLIFEKAVPVI